jgi:hypothetical protein
MKYHCTACGRPSKKRTCSDAFCGANCYVKPSESYYLTLGFKKEYVAGNGVDAEMWISPSGVAYYELPFLSSEQESSFKLAQLQKLLNKIADASFEGCEQKCLCCGEVNDLVAEALRVVCATPE